MYVLQISIPMSAEFEELMKARDNPSEEAQSKSRLGINLYVSNVTASYTCRPVSQLYTSVKCIVQ